MKQIKVSQLMIVTVLALASSAPAGAAYVVTQLTLPCGNPLCVAAAGFQTNQAAINTTIAPILSASSATELYKKPVGQADTGNAAAWYNTTFSSSSTNPQDATIEWGGPGFISGSPKFLLVKGNSAFTILPKWFLFNISNWDGTETIKVKHFWPLTNNAITHVTIYGSGTRTSVPDGGMTLMLLGGALFGLETLRRRISA